MHAFRRSALILWALCACLFCLPTLPSQDRAATLQAEAERQFKELHQRMQDLESVLARNPDHAGALHLYIHAMEASAQPERAVEAVEG